MVYQVGFKAVAMVIQLAVFQPCILTIGLKLHQLLTIFQLHITPASLLSIIEMLRQ